MDIEKLNKNYSADFDMKFWRIIRSNVDSIDEAIEWDNLIKKEFNLQPKIILDKGLKDIIKVSMPNNVDKNFWEIWTNQILKQFDIKPKELYITLRRILTGKKFGPSMNDLLTLIEKDEIMRRVDINCE